MNALAEQIDRDLRALRRLGNGIRSRLTSERGSISLASCGTDLAGGRTGSPAGRLPRGPIQVPCCKRHAGGPRHDASGHGGVGAH